jgi:hypothetical protein
MLEPYIHTNLLYEEGVFQCIRKMLELSNDMLLFFAVSLGLVYSSLASAMQSSRAS